MNEQLTIDGRAEAMANNGTRLTTVGTRLLLRDHWRLKNEAERRECSMAAILREAVVEWLDTNGRA